MPGDGHCIASHCKEPEDKVLNRVNKEFCENSAMSGFDLTGRDS